MSSILDLLKGIFGSKRKPAPPKSAPKGSVTPPPAPSPEEPAWMELAEDKIGLKEIPGPKHNPEIVKMFAEIGHAWVNDDETPWCAAFANWVLKRSGIKGTGKLNARSFLDWGQKLKKPRYGCVVVFKRGMKSWQGHVAFYVRETATHIYVLGGNQRNEVNIRPYRKEDLLGYRWPAEEEAQPSEEFVAIDHINFRAKAGPEGRVMTVLKPGQVVHVIDRSSKWWKVEADGWIGYLLSDYLTEA